MFGNKFSKLTAAIGREDHSDDQMNELNAELMDRGLVGLAVVRNSDLVQKETELNDAISKAKTASDSLATITADRDEWKGKAEAYGDQPGAVRTTSMKKKDATGTDYAINPDADYNQRAYKATGKSSQSN